MKNSMMKNIFSYIAIAFLSLLSGVASAHLGHGEHAAVYASQPHPVFGLQEILVVALTVSAIYLVLRLVRK